MSPGHDLSGSVLFFGRKSLSAATLKGRDVKRHLQERGVATRITGKSAVRKVPSGVFGLLKPGIFKTGTLEKTDNHNRVAQDKTRTPPLTCSTTPRLLFFSGARSTGTSFRACHRVASP